MPILRRSGKKSCSTSVLVCPWYIQVRSVLYKEHLQSSNKFYLYCAHMGEKSREASESGSNKSVE